MLSCRLNDSLRVPPNLQDRNLPEDRSSLLLKFILVHTDVYELEEELQLMDRHLRGLNLSEALQESQNHLVTQVPRDILDQLIHTESILLPSDD